MNLIVSKILMLGRDGLDESRIVQVLLDRSYDAGIDLSSHRAELESRVRAILNGPAPAKNDFTSIEFKPRTSR